MKTMNEIGPDTFNQKQWHQLWQGFYHLMELPDCDQAAFKSEWCATHPELADTLQKLVSAHQSKDSVLDQSLYSEQVALSFSPPKEIAGFIIREHLGSGGVADVFKAVKQEPGFERTVAIKFATVGRFAPWVIERFNNELQALLNLHHSHIERLYEGGVTEDGVPYLVVEYIEGAHIDQYVNLHKLGLAARLRMFGQVCEAVAVMHASLLIHRDIKPANILVTEQGVPKLLDFGLAKFEEPDIQQNQNTSTLSSHMMTLAYASPEQIKNQPLTTASDVYSLGVLLYLLCCGQHPYQTTEMSLLSIEKELTEGPVIIASQGINAQSVIAQKEPRLKQKLSGELSAIIAKAMHIDAASRYRSAQQLLEDIQRFKNHQPVQAKPDSSAYRFAKWVRRHQAVTVVSGVMVVAVMSLLVMLFIRTSELQEALNDTRQEQQRVEQVTGFLVDVFKLTDPLGQSAQFAQVKDVINEARDQLATAFQGDLKTRRKLRMTLASIYLNMSDVTSAQTLINQARDMNEGMTLAEQFQLLMTQVGIYIQLGELKKADRAVAQFQSQQSTQAMTLNQQNQLDFLIARLAYLAGHYQQADTKLNRLKNKLASDYKIQPDLLAEVYQLLGNVAWKQGQLKQAQDYYSQAHQHFISQYGALHNRSLKSLSTIAVLDYSLGHYEAALKHFEAVLAARQQQLGENHKLTADAHNRLAAVYFELGQLDQADSHYSTALQTYENLKLSASLVYARVLNNQALLWRQQQKYSQAVQILNQSRQIQQQQLGVDHADLTSVENNLGLLSYDLGDIDGAINWFQKAYQRQIKKYPKPPVSAAYAMNNLAHMYLLKAELVAAKKWARDSLNLRLEHFDESHLLVSDNLMILARLAWLNQQPDQAQSLLKTAIDIRLKHLKDTDWRVLETRLWQSLFGSGGLSIADRDQALMSLCQRFGPSHPKINNLFEALAIEDDQKQMCRNQ
ncbi:MAG: serine/threonine-protein kinase [Proteobacteria bacterium]|nr:serine/threonine-protein kinase [Pseudomonadota bacterium]